MTNPTDVTALLRAWRDGDNGALDRLVPHVEQELHRLAKHYMRGERVGHSLQATALVNEAYLRLVDARHINWQSRAHFIGMAATLMRRVLVDAARARGAGKRGGGAVRVTFDEQLEVVDERGHGLVALDAALTALAILDPRKGRVVEVRCFGGLSVRETAEALGVSEDTVMRDWRLAKAWLKRELATDKDRSRLPGDRDS